MWWHWKKKHKFGPVLLGLENEEILARFGLLHKFGTLLLEPEYEKPLVKFVEFSFI
jgi:hypothetical protein